MTDGGQGIDFLVGAPGRDNLDAMLQSLHSGAVSNVEVLVTHAPDSLGLTSLQDFKDLGVTVRETDHGATLSLSDAWTESANSAHIPDGFVEMVHHGSADDGSDDTTILVQRAILENNQGG